MRIHVLFFAVYRELAGSDEITVDLPHGATVRRLIEAVAERLGADLAPGNLAVAVNQEYATEERVLEDGDEVAFIPPVAGG